MAKRKVSESKEVNKAQIKALLLKQADVLYQQQLNDEMGRLHNRFVAFISESKLPLPQVFVVLDILKDECVELARKQYLGVKDGGDVEKHSV